MKGLTKRKTLSPALRGPQKGRAGPSKAPTRKPPPRPKPNIRRKGPEALTVEMIDTLRDVIEGAVLGDFAKDPGAANMAGQIALGFVPILGQLADVRDIIAAGKKVFDGEDGGWADLGFATLGVVPGMDGFKAARKTTKNMRMVAPANVSKSLPKGPSFAGKARARAHLMSTTVLSRPDFHKRYFEARKIALDILSKPGIKAEELGGLSMVEKSTKFRRDAQRLIYNDPNHDLRFLLTEEGVFLPGRMKGIGMEQWRHHPELMEVGHEWGKAAMKAGHGGKKEVLALQTTLRNRVHGAMEGKGRGFRAAYIRIEIGGVPMGLESAIDLVMADDKLTLEALSKARLILDEL